MSEAPCKTWAHLQGMGSAGWQTILLFSAICIVIDLVSHDLVNHSVIPAIKRLDDGILLSANH